MVKILPILLQETNNKINNSNISSPELYSLARSAKGSIPSSLIYQIRDNNSILIKLTFNKGIDKEDGFNWFVQEFKISTTIKLRNIISSNSIDLYFPIRQLLALITDVDLNKFFESVKNVYPPIRNSGVVGSNGDITQKSSIVRNSFRLNFNGECLPVNGSGVKIGVISDSFNTQIYTRFINPDLQINPNESKATIDIQNGDLPGSGNPNGYSAEVQVIKENQFGATDEGRAMLQIIHDIAPGAELAFYSASTQKEFKNAIKALEDQGCSIIVDDLTFIEESFFVAESEISIAIQDFMNKHGNLFFTSAGNFGKYGYQDVFRSSKSKPDLNFLELNNKARAHLFKEGKDYDIFQKVKFKETGIYMLVVQWEESLSLKEKKNQYSNENYPDLDIYLIYEDNSVIGNNHINKFDDNMELLGFYAEKDATAKILIVSANGEPVYDLNFRYIVFLNNNGFQLENENHGDATVSGHAMIKDIITVGAASDDLQMREYSSIGGKLKNGYNIEIDFVAPDGENTNLDLIGPDTNKDHFQNFYGTSAAAPHAAGAFALVMSSINYCKSNGITINSEDILKWFKETCTNFDPSVASGAGLLNVEDAFEIFLHENQIPDNVIANNIDIPCEVINDKTVVQIIACDISCEYGQSWKFELRVEGIPSGQTIKSLGLPQIKFKTTAILPYPDVNNYVITPYFACDISEELALDYYFEFVKGHLNITKKDLKISASVIKSIPGMPIDFELNYEYDTNGIANNNLFYSTISEEHKSTFHSNNVHAIIEGFLFEDNVFQQLLNESSWIVSEKYIQKNVIKFLGSSIIKLMYDNIKEYLEFLNSESIDSSSRFFWPLVNKYKPLVNKYKPLVNKYKPLVNKYKPLVNKYKPLVNKYKPLVNTEDDTDFENESLNNSMHLIIDDEFFTNTDDNTYNEYFSINVISGTLKNKEHYIFPGAFLSPMAINFNITYGSEEIIEKK